MVYATPKEVARMWTLTHTDRNATAVGRQVCVQVGTPDPWLINLFARVFGRHADIEVRPTIGVDGRPKWHAWCLLPVEGYLCLLGHETAICRN